MSTTVGRAGVCMCGVLIDNEKKMTCSATCLRQILGPACLQRWVAWGVCVYVCGVLMVNKKPYKPTSPPTRPRETKVKNVGPGVSSKKHVVQLVCVASWCRHDVYNYGRATTSNIVMSVSVSGFVVKKGSHGWNERMPSSPNTESPCGSDLFMIQPIFLLDMLLVHSCLMGTLAHTL